MPQTIILAYNGAANGHLRVLASYPAYLAERCYLAINLAGYLGILVDSIDSTADFHSTGYAVADNTWTGIGCTLSGTTIGIFAAGLRRGTFTVAASVESYLTSRIGNLTPSRLILARTGLAPSANFAPSANLAPSDNSWDANVSAGGIIDEVHRYDAVMADAEINQLNLAFTLYEALPEFPLPDGYGDEPQDNIIETKMETGPSKTRLRSTAAPRYLTRQYYLSTVQRQILDQFYDSLGGVNPFYYTITDSGQVVTVKFKPNARPRYQIDGLGYRASFVLEVVP